MKKLPQFATFSECKRLVFNSWQNKSLRPGQALCNRFAVDAKLEHQIYEEQNVEKVIQKVWNFCNSSKYQNK